MSDESTKQPRHTAILSVGSNIEPQTNVRRAAEILAQEHRLLDESRFIQTAPDGFQDQPDFLNGAFYVATNDDYDTFNQYLKAVEKRLGRVKGPIKSGPRTIDLDIIVWNGRVVHADYPAKDYTRDPVDEILGKHQLSIED